MNSLFVRKFRLRHVCLPAVVTLALLMPVSTAFAASAAPTGDASAVSGGLDPNTTETATHMMPAGSPDAVGSAATAESGSARSANLQATAPGDVEGIDVASYQHPGNAPIDWVAVRNSGVVFAFVKATESTGYTNPFYASDVAQARAAGLYVGAYHYALPQYNAVAQANYMADVMGRSPATNLPPTLDLEENGGLSSAQLVTWVDAFLRQLLARTGRVPIIYTGQGFWNSSMGGTTAFGSYTLWDANWTTNPTPAAVPGWSRWTFWQYTNGTYNNPPMVPGIQALTDRNRFSGGITQLAEFANGVTGRWVVTAGTKILNGTPQVGQIDYYSTVIDNGSASRTSVALALLGGVASLNREVNLAYSQALGRSVDEGSLPAWTGARMNGLSETGIRAALASSAEFYQAAGSTPAGFVSRLYTRMLGRGVDSGGLAGWTNLLAQGASRQQVAQAVIGSVEGLGVQINQAYQLVLGRSVDSGGLAGSIFAFTHGWTWEMLQASLFGSAEFQAQVG